MVNTIPQQPSEWTGKLFFQCLEECRVIVPLAFQGLEQFIPRFGNLGPRRCAHGKKRTGTQNAHPDEGFICLCYKSRADPALPHSPSSG